jgi:hypothetical protein
MDPDRIRLDPAVFVIDLPDANKNLFLFLSFTANYFLKVHLHHFKEKVIKSHEIVGIKVFLTNFAWWWKDPGSDPDSYLWLTDPDPNPGRPNTQNCNKGIVQCGGKARIWIFMNVWMYCAATFVLSVKKNSRQFCKLTWVRIRHKGFCADIMQYIWFCA